ncbi:MAG: flavin monoamine oxidase family protein [Flavobacteriales bacterium]
MMNRRQFAKSSLLSIPSAFMMSSLLHSCRKDFTDLNVKFKGKVIVIGAGISGLHAAKFLRLHGCEVTHLEASNRIGGRILSHNGFADFPIELGAEAVHGKRNILFDLATAKGFELRTSDKEDYFRLYNQTRRESDIEDNPNLSFLFQIIDSFGSYSGLDNNVASYMERIGLDPFIKNIAEALVGNEYGTNNERLSIRGIAVDDAQWTTGNDDYFFTQRSYGEFLNTVYQDEISKVLLDKAVTKINYENSVVVETADGETFTADRVLITVPISILKSGMIEFVPPLPDSKNQALESMEMDTGMKIIMKFGEKFWPDDLSSLIGGSVIPEYWITGVLRNSNEHLLTAFVMGEKAEQLAAMGNDAIHAVTAELNQYFVTQAASNNLQQFLIKNWMDEPFVQGAYSYIKAGQVNQRKAYAAPITTKCFFGGEAANYTGHPATVHGAMETGFDQAKLILETE